MLYRPVHEVGWDTWIVPHQGRFLMFYIRITPGKVRAAPPPSLGEGWDGVSLATSDDLLHWTEEGAVLEAADDAAWLGTGIDPRGGRALHHECLRGASRRSTGHRLRRVDGPPKMAAAPPALRPASRWRDVPGGARGQRRPLASLGLTRRRTASGRWLRGLRLRQHHGIAAWTVRHPGLLALG